MIILRDYQINLINKVKQSLINGYKAPLLVAPCGAGKSIMIAYIIKSANDKGNTVIVIVHRRELKDQLIDTFKSVGIDLNLTKVFLIQTLSKNLNIIPPSIIITDETHHSNSNMYLKVYNHFNNAIKIGFTATPIRLDNKGLGDIYDIMIDEIDVNYLINNNYLSPYKCFVPQYVSSKSVKNRDFTKNEIEQIMQNYIYGDVIKHYKNFANNTQAIIYAHSIKKSQEIVAIFNNHGLNAVHIDGNTKKQEREQIIKDFKIGKIKILSNVDLIGEGFDVPDCETVILLRPTMSLSLYIQQAMRSMRYKAGKTAIILDCVGNTIRHGLVNDKREWDLKGKKTNKKNNSTSIMVSTCEECFAAYNSKLRQCPMCGFVRPQKSIEITTLEGETLQEIKFKSFEILKKENCKSYQDLLKYAKNMGYKSGWAYIQAKERGYLC